MAVYRIVICEGRTGERKAYKVKALTRTEAVRRVQWVYRGRQPIEIVEIKEL